jgi:hypothetical protein
MTIGIPHEGSKAYPGIIVEVKFLLQSADLLWLDKVDIVNVNEGVLHKHSWIEECLL